MKALKVLLIVLVVAALGGGAYYFLQKRAEMNPAGDIPAPAATAQPDPSASPAPTPSPGATDITTAAPAPGKSVPVDLTTDSAGLSKATVVMKTSKGTVKFKFYSKDAPNHVARMVELIQSKFYSGLTFHRVVPGFVIQTGDPKSRNKNDPSVGSNGTGKFLKLEVNGRKHLRGTVGMARAADRDSADSQFYFTMGNYPHLDPNYTVFGQVVDYGEKIGDKDVLDRLVQWDEVIDIRIE